jgi:hypothetical protein
MIPGVEAGGIEAAVQAKIWTPHYEPYRRIAGPAS